MLKGIRELALVESDMSKLSMPVLGGAALGLAAGVGGLYALDPYVRGQLNSEVEMMFPGGKEKYQYTKKDHKFPQQAIERADKFRKEMLKRGFDPKKHNIAISATGGTGKTTLAEILARDLGMKAQKERSALGMGRGLPLNLRKKDTKAGTIYEQTHLLNIVDPDKFDAAIYLKSPTQKIYDGLKKRKYGAIQRHIYDYDLQNKVTGNMFSHLPGEEVQIGEGAYLKIKPKEGFNQDKLLTRALQEKGYSPDDIDKMDREERVYALSGHRNRVKNLKRLGIYERAPVLAAPEYKHKGLATLLGITGGATLAGALLAARK